MSLDPKEYRILFDVGGPEEADEDPEVRFVRKQLLALLDVVVLKWRDQEVQVDGFELITRPGVQCQLRPQNWGQEAGARAEPGRSSKPAPPAFEEITVFLTTRCNAQCAHCPEVNNTNPADIPWELARVLIKEAAAEGVRVLSLTGGEPALYPHFQDLVRLGAECGVQCSVVSNGRDFDPYEEMLRRYPGLLAGISFSLDGHDASSHDAIRGQQSFHKLIHSLGRCLALGMKPGINVCLSRKNIDQLEAILDFLAGTPVASVALVTIHADQDPENVALSTEQRETVWPRVETWKAKRDRPPSWPLSFHPALFRPQNADRQRVVFSTSPCDLFGFKIPAIRPDGGVYFCCNIAPTSLPLAHLSVDPQGHLVPALADLGVAGIEGARRLRAERDARLADVTTGDAEVDTCEFCATALQPGFPHGPSEKTS